MRRRLVCESREDRSHVVAPRFSFRIRCLWLYRRGEPPRDCNRKNWYSTRDIGQLDAGWRERERLRPVHLSRRQAYRSWQKKTYRTSVKVGRCPSYVMRKTIWVTSRALHLMHRWPTGLNCGADNFYMWPWQTFAYLIGTNVCWAAHFAKFVETTKKNPDFNDLNPPAKEFFHRLAGDALLITLIFPLIKMKKNRKFWFLVTNKKTVK